MDKRNSSYGKWKRPWRYSQCISNKWHQSKILGKPLRSTPKLEFEQRKIKRDKEERIGKCIRQITKGCKDMLKKKIEEIRVHNSAVHKATTRSLIASIAVKRDISLNHVMQRSETM
nr:ARID DNA-binding domain-containing protein [Tanacetum cinerariifolium]